MSSVNRSEWLTLDRSVINKPNQRWKYSPYGQKLHFNASESETCWVRSDSNLGFSDQNWQRVYQHAVTDQLHSNASNRNTLVICNPFSPILDLSDERSETSQGFWHRTAESLLRDAVEIGLLKFVPGGGLKRALARGETRLVLGVSLAADSKSIRLLLRLLLKPNNT